MARTRYDSDVVYKFLLSKIKKLVKSQRGELKYMQNFDNIIHDIFGVKHFTKKINELYDRRDLICVIEDVGSKELMAIMNNSRYYDAMRELVMVNHRMETLKKVVHKQRKKGKSYKKFSEEYEYLLKLYKKSIKRFRKFLGIKSTKTSYKKKYSSLNSIVKNDYDDDRYSGLLDDDDFENDYDDDYYDDDDYESNTEFDEYVKRSSRGNRKKSNTTRRRVSSQYDDFDLDDDFDDDEDEEYPRSVPSMDDRAIAQLNNLTDTVSELAGAVQSLMNKNEYESSQRRKMMYQEPEIPRYQYSPDRLRPSGTNVDVNKEVAILTDFMGRMSDEQVRMKDNQKTMARALDQIINNENKIMSALAGAADDDDSVDDYERDADGGSLSREEIIDMVNGTADTPVRPTPSI